MKITIAPINAGFINRILFFNLTQEPFSDDEIFRERNIHLAFVLDEAYVGIDLENYLFYCYIKKTLDWYGPYTSYQEMITNMLFGQYDGLFQVLGSVKFKEELSLFEFDFDGFMYNITTYKFSVPLRKTAQTLSQTIVKINQKFVYSFKPETSYSEGVINEFLISLNNLFTTNNFPQKVVENDSTTLISIDRKKVAGHKTPEKYFLLINTSSKRHLVAYLPYWIYKGYVTYENKSSNKSFLNELFDVNTTKTISNAKEVLLARKMFGIKVDEKETELFKSNIYKYIMAIVPADDEGNVNYILKKDGMWYILQFNGVTRHYTLLDFKEFETFDYKAHICNDRFVIGKCCGNVEDFDVVINATSGCIFFNTKSGLVQQQELHYDIRFTSNIEGIL